jgi:magnesium-transporting ATPase (P-type)
VEYNENWHNLTQKSVLSKLESTIDGLSEDEAQRRLTTHGFNKLPQTSKQNSLVSFLKQFHNTLIYVLLFAALITAFLGHLYDTLTIIAVVLANAIIGFIQEGKAEKAMDALRQMLAPQASVLRSGVRITVPGESLVPGDIVILEAGDKVPADLRLLSVHSMSVEEAILTGESIPTDKKIDKVPVDAPLGDRNCMVYSGTLVVAGQGNGVVVGTGGTAELGRISRLLSNIEILTTPLVKQMDVFAKWLTVFILLIATLLFLYGYFVWHYPFSEMFLVVVGLSVAAIPEGLPAILTITLSIGVQAMARRNAIVRRLPAIETLGSVSVICTDKTGTLTHNEMMVASAVAQNHQFTIEGVGYKPKGVIRLDGVEVYSKDFHLLEELARASALCNDAALSEHEDIWTVEGDPMEGALLAFARKAGMDLKLELAKWTRTDTIPFDASHRFMATLNHNHEGQALVFVKGAPERIFSMCKNQRSTTNQTELFDKASWLKKLDNIAVLGQRVLALAVRSVRPEHTVLKHEDLEDELTLIGIVGLIDPPRSEAISAVAECHSAGIRVKMITGDHAGTAMAIAKQVGLQNTSEVLTGADLDKMDDAVLKEAVLGTDIFARTNPENKLRLVMALQSHSFIVAMTGDGVNDTPALKRADAGIAMGMKGSEAAKEAADLVLADDNFASIVAAVREGRTVYDNIKKVISWTLPTNGGEALTIIVALLLGMTLPVTPIQILWINLITAATLGIALAFEPTEENTMRRPPRSRNEPLLNGALVWHIMLVSVLFLCGIFGIFNFAIDKGYSLELARTMSLNTVVAMEIFYLFFIRNIYGTSLTWKAVRGTKVVWLTVVLITVAQLAITYLSPLQRIFATQSIPLSDGLIIVCIGIALFAIVETEKLIRLRFYTLNRH